MIGKRKLGRTSIEISRLGISSSFGAKEDVYKEAFERGCNYFTYGTFIKGRSNSFQKFMREQVKQGKRKDLVVGLLSYSHSTFLGDAFFTSACKQLGTDYIDGLILGYFSKRPSDRLLEWALKLKESGRVRAIGLTTHNRKVVSDLAHEGIVDYFHFRYNAVHRGAEIDIFPNLPDTHPGLISFTATTWGKLLNQKKMEPGETAPTAGDCYRFVLSRDEIDCCMMGVRDQQMLKANLDEIEKGEMTLEEVARMCRVGDHLYGKRR